MAGDTRKLCIVDTANRLLANAARLRWEQNISGWLASEQHGFLPRRSMLANVVELENTAMHYALAHAAPAIVLYDFPAAFPSISQEFLFRTLSNLGFPSHVIQFVKSLYYENQGVPTQEGVRGESFRLTAGIRQGCPQSPLLFVLVVDGLIRRTALASSLIFVRMYADDTAMVLSDYFQRELPILVRIFGDLQHAAHLSRSIWENAYSSHCSKVRTKIAESRSGRLLSRITASIRDSTSVPARVTDRGTPH